MLAWLSANLGTIIVCAALAAVVVLILGFMRKNKKKGKSSCGGGCAGCSMAGKCRPQPYTAHGCQPEEGKK